MILSRWPRWAVILIGLVLAVAAIVIALVLEPVAQAVAPKVEPTSTLPLLAYALPLSGDCQKCHFDQVALAHAGAGKDELDRLTIEPESLWTPHGGLGCVTCHRGTGSIEDVDAAHVGMITDPSLRFSEECLLCHRNLPEEFPQDRLRTPHNEVVHGETVNVACSDCHGGVGHGFDPVTGEVICSMAVCLDCHRTRQLDSKLTDCNACHIGPHDLAAAMECSVCHQSTEVWHEVELAVHPVELVGRHAEVQCFDCHQEPNFRGIHYICSDCHQRPHDFGSDDCAECHNPAAGWEAAGVGGEHPFPQDHNGTNGNCTLCHPGGDTTTYSCETCHSQSGMQQVHEAKGVKDIASKCVLCHPQGQKP